MPVDLFSLLGNSRASSRRHTEDGTAGIGPLEGRRENVRIVGYHNALLDQSFMSSSFDSPPSYENAQEEFFARRAEPRATAEHAPDRLPGYSCTVTAEGTVGMKLELSSPFEAHCQPQWIDLFAVLRGTILSLHQVKTAGFLSRQPKSGRSADSAGRLLKTYSLQHAEVGVAADHDKVELVPRSHLTELLPAHTIEQLKRTDPNLFFPVRQYVMRLRLEGDQLLLRTQSGDSLIDWLRKLCSAIDIAPPLDDRTEPRYHTLPRRRRRPQAPTQAQLENMIATAETLVEQQERLIQEYHPSLSAHTEEQTVEVDGSTQDSAQAANPFDPDAEDLDTNVVLNGPETPPTERPNPFANMFQSINNIFDPQIQDMNEIRSLASQAASTSASTNLSNEIQENPNLDENGKWRPHYKCTRASEARYRRRCLPSLCYHSNRANGVIFQNGKRYEIDWDERILRPHPSPPPEYQATVKGSIPTQSASNAGITTRPEVRQYESSSSVGSSVIEPFLVEANDRESQHQDDISTARGSPQSPSPTFGNSAAKQASSWRGRLKKIAIRKEDDSFTRQINNHGNARATLRVRSIDLRKAERSPTAAAFDQEAAFALLGL